MSHVSHLAPTLVVVVGCVRVASVIRALAVEFGIIGVIDVVLDFTL